MRSDRKLCAILYQIQFDKIALRFLSERILVETYSMDEYIYDELGMALGFALFAVRMSTNNPTEESYRGDGYSMSNRNIGSPAPTRSALRRQISRNDSTRSEAASFGISSLNKCENNYIPDEDITTYTTEEIGQFNEFQRKQSALIDYTTGYSDQQVEIYGENYDIPIFDGPAYSDDEILKFDLFQKAKSANVAFEQVYESDDEFEGENYNIPDEDAQEYTEEEIEDFAHLEHASSAFVHFGVYREEGGQQSEKLLSTNNPAFHTSLHLSIHTEENSPYKVSVEGQISDKPAAAASETASVSEAEAILAEHIEELDTLSNCNSAAPIEPLTVEAQQRIICEAVQDAKADNVRGSMRSGSNNFTPQLPAVMALEESAAAYMAALGLSSDGIGLKCGTACTASEKANSADASNMPEVGQVDTDEFVVVSRAGEVGIDSECNEVDSTFSPLKQV